MREESIRPAMAATRKYFTSNIAQGLVTQDDDPGNRMKP
jgi:hypothetical protein